MVQSEAMRISTRSISLLLVIVIASLSQISNAQNDFFNSIDVDIRREDSRSGANYSVIGWITQKISQGIERPGPQFSRRERELNKIETSLFGQIDSGLGENFNFRVSGKAYHDEIYRINDDTNYSADERNKFRNRIELKDFYIERQFTNGFYFKAGNQILAWGMAEYSRVTDLINTEDQYTFGQQDLEDIRLQVPAVLLSYSSADWTFDGVITHRAGRNDTAPAGDEFDQLIGLRQSGLSLERADPEDEQEYFFRASTHLSQGDLQLVAGEFNDNALSLEQVAAIRSIAPRFQYGQNRMRAIGVAANWADGLWLVFGELGMHFDKAVIPSADSVFRQVGGWDEKDQVLSVLGIEYNGFRNLLLSFEIDRTRTKNHDDFMYADKNQTSFGSRIYWTALNEKLQVLAVRNELANRSGQVSRVSVDYSWSDNLELGLLWVDYGSREQSNFYDFRNNDVLQLHLRYNFQI